MLRAAGRVLASAFAFLVARLFADILLSLVPGGGGVAFLTSVISLAVAVAAAVQVWSLTEPRGSADEGGT